MAHLKADGVWLGLKKCGCPVAVTVDAPDIPRKHLNESKRQFLREGLSVLYASWEDWQTKWMPIFKLDCEHDPKPARPDDLFAKAEGR